MTGSGSACPHQVAKLIPRPASEHDGEVVATARAIERCLRSAGLDLHALAERAGSGPDVHACAPPQPPPPRPAPPAAWKAPKPREPGWSDMRRSQQFAWCAVLLDELTMSDTARRLVAEVRAKLHVGQNFYLAPRHKRELTGLVKAARAAGHFPEEML